MEALFRRHFWILHTLSLAVSAYLLAQAVNVVIGQLLAQSAPTAAATGPLATGPRGRVRNFEAAANANIFDAKRETVVEKALADAAPAEPKEEEEKKDPSNPDFDNAVRTELDVTLVGTSVFSVAKYSLATIAADRDDALLYSINDCPKDPVLPVPSEDGPDPSVFLPEPTPCNDLLDGKGTIVKIDLERIYLLNHDENRYEFLDLEEPPEKTPAQRAKARRKKRQKKQQKKQDKYDGIKKVGANRYEVEQKEIDSALSNLSSLATQARIVPAFEGGQSVGFKLFSIRPGSLYSKIGIQNGDVISGVNGYELNSPDKALEVYQKLRDSKSITVDIKRRGKPITLDYSVTP